MSIALLMPYCETSKPFISGLHFDAVALFSLLFITLFGFCKTFFPNKSGSTRYNILADS